MKSPSNFFAAIGLALALGVALPWGLMAQGAGTEEIARAETAFATFVQSHGGSEVVGPPAGPAVPHPALPGRFSRYYRNFKLEYLPELAGTPYQVQPSLLGAMAIGARWYPKSAPFRSDKDVVFFPQTGHSVRFGFLDFFRATGGIELLGYPLTEEQPQGDGSIQYFQRGALRFNPTLAPSVQPIPLGEEIAARESSPWHARVRARDVPALVAPGTTVRLTVELENAGSARWPAAGADRVAIGFHWKSQEFLANAFEGQEFSLPRAVGAGETLTFALEIVAPPRPGAFDLIWDPKRGGEWLSQLGTVAGQTSITVGTEVPAVRVGILELGPDNPDDKRATISATAPFKVETLSGRVLASLDAGVRIAAVHEDGVYKLQIFAGKTLETAEPVVFRTDPSALMIVDEIQPGNRYRGSFEFRYSPELQSAWLINTLPVEDYLAGLIEQGEDAPWESLKASVIAFRTYALAVKARMKIKNFEPFDLASSTTHTPSYFTRHQFYVGYRRELDGNRLRQAIEATRGRVISHQGSLIEAVYFSQANGRTYSWDQIWGPPGRPWAIGVDDPVSAGTPRVGHGVGLPLRSANALAAQGYLAEQILQTYYSGVDFTFAY